MGSDALGRVAATLPAGALEALGAGLAPTDLQTLLLAVARERAARVTPAGLLRRRRADRFVRPSTADPRRLARLEARLWELLPDAFEGVELSPVVPLGTTSALGPTDQHRVVSTVRGTEVLSDPTNALALEAALRRAGGGPGTVRLAGCHRVLRAQPFPAGWSQHFRLFALVSSARDTGSGRTEASLLAEHGAFYLQALRDLLPGRDVRLELSAFGAGPVADRLADTVVPALRGQGMVERDDARTRARGYYTSAALRITLDGAEVGDGGFTGWTASLLQDAKERCLISCVSTERLLVPA
jgi:hypothetical protein